MEQKVDLRTQREKARDIEHNRIVNTYLAYRQNPAYDKVKDSRIFGMIAKDPGISVSTTCGVRQILVKYGVYQNKR